MTSLISAVLNTLRGGGGGEFNSFTRKELRQYRIVFLFTKVLILFVTFVTLAPQKATAQWTDIGKINGIQVYRDEKTGLEWTVSQSRATTVGQARQTVASLGFRLPSHSEFRSLERNRGIQKLGIRTARGYDFIWTNTGQMVNGNGGNFQTLFPANTSFPARLNQANWVIGVRDTRGEVSAEPIIGVEPLQTGSQPATVSSSTPSRPSVSTTNKPPVTSPTQTPNVTRPVLPTLPTYD